jgi:hypothetical protein
MTATLMYADRAQQVGHSQDGAPLQPVLVGDCPWLPAIDQIVPQQECPQPLLCTLAVIEQVWSRPTQIAHCLVGRSGHMDRHHLARPK